jgi:hypothetical protein
MALHGYVRATKDLDVWIRPTPENAARVMKALIGFGAPLHDLTIDDLSRPGLIFQIGVDPVRIDLITKIDGVTFQEAWPERIKSSLDSQAVSVLSRRLMVANKRATGRPQDQIDADWLERNPAQK